jgi:hypothetical protein
MVTLQLPWDAELHEHIGRAFALCPAVSTLQRMQQQNNEISHVTHHSQHMVKQTPQLAVASNPKPNV